MVSVGLNGFGRFSLRLFRIWLKQKLVGKANFDIVQINEPFRSFEEIRGRILSDPVAGEFNVSIELKNDLLCIDEKLDLALSREENIEAIEWKPSIEMIFECGGKFTDKSLAQKYLQEDIKKVLISATSLSADKTIIIGFNETEYDSKKHNIVSYGSCTTNCFLPVAKLIHQNFGIKTASASVIHATPLERIEKPFGKIRFKPCTLEFAGPALFPVLKEFFVSYRMVPYPAVSLMDLVFETEELVSKEKINDILQKASQNRLDGIIGFDSEVRDSNQYIGSPFSAIIIGPQTRVVGKKVLLSAWFDSENSATRFFDVAQLMANKT